MRDTKETDARAAEGFLKARGQAANAPTTALVALMLINSAGAAALAWFLTRVLVGRAAWPFLVGLVTAMLLRGLAAWAVSRLAARHALGVKSLVRREL